MDASESVRSATSELDAIAKEEEEMVEVRGKIHALKEELNEWQQKVQAYDASAPSRRERINDLQRKRTDNEEHQKGLKRRLDEGEETDKKRRAVVDKMYSCILGVGDTDIVSTTTTEPSGEGMRA